MSIKVKQLSKQYNIGKKSTYSVLKNISFSVNTGEKIAIVGKSGSGKSTLMHIMAGLERATSGEVMIEDVYVTSLSSIESNVFRNQMVGFVFQTFYLFAQETVFENIAWPLRIRGLSTKDIKRKVYEVIEAVGLGDKRNSLPHILSGGQKQRVCIARALVTDPKVIFADECTGNLDSETGDQILDILFSQVKSQKKTLIMVTHDEDIAKKCDRRFVLRDGVIQV